MGRELGSRSVYVIGVTLNPVKIGIADRAERRLAELQVGCPDKLHLHHKVRVPFHIAEMIERDAHAALAEHHRHGEWFNVDAAEALAVIEAIRSARLAEYQFAARGHGDLISDLAAKFPLDRDARSAAHEYMEKLDEKDAEYTGLANGFVLQEVGQLAYAAFSLVIAQRTRLTGLNPAETDRAEAALVKSLNALAAFSRKYQKIKGDYAALRRAKEWRRDVPRRAA